MPNQPLSFCAISIPPTIPAAGNPTSTKKLSGVARVSMNGTAWFPHITTAMKVPRSAAPEANTSGYTDRGVERFCTILGGTLIRGGEMAKSPNYRNHAPALYWAQRGKCALCQSVLLDDMQVDHIWPVSKGGKSFLENLQLVCAECNLHKGSTVPSDEQILQGRHRADRILRAVERRLRHISRGAIGVALSACRLNAEYPPARPFSLGEYRRGIPLRVHVKPVHLLSMARRDHGTRYIAQLVQSGGEVRREAVVMMTAWRYGIPPHIVEEYASMISNPYNGCLQEVQRAEQRLLIVRPQPHGHEGRCYFD